MAIVRYTLEELEKMPDLTDWERVLNMKDEDIDMTDEDNPEWTAEDFARATRPGLMEQPQRVSIYLRPSLLKHYQNTGKDWRTRLSDDFEAFSRQAHIAVQQKYISD